MITNRVVVCKNDFQLISRSSLILIIHKTIKPFKEQRMTGNIYSLHRVFKYIVYSVNYSKPLTYSEVASRKSRDYQSILKMYSISS